MLGVDCWDGVAEEVSHQFISDIVLHLRVRKILRAPIQSICCTCSSLAEPGFGCHRPTSVGALVGSGPVSSLRLCNHVTDQLFILGDIFFSLFARAHL